MFKIIIRCIEGLDIFILAFIFGISINPVGSLALALLSGFLNNRWLYWTTPFVRTSIIALIFRRKKFMIHTRYRIKIL
jgi:hypothetical protein